MSFLYASALVAGLWVAVPLILHLRRRHTDRRIAFPALRYLTLAEDERSRSLRASDVLLLAVRMATVLLLALAAAGPLLGRGGAGDHPPSDVAILIDNSASAGQLDGEQPLLTRFLALARLSVEQGRPEDRFWIQPLVGPATAAGVTAARALEAVDRVVASAGGGSLTGAISDLAAALPAEPGRRREIQVLSDLQATGLRLAPDPAPAGERTASATATALPVVIYVPGAAPSANGAISALSLSAGHTVPAGISHGVAAAVRRYPEPAAGDTGRAALRLRVGGQLAGAARAPWGGSAVLPIPDLSPGRHEGLVSLEPDGLRADDARYFAFEVVPAPAVAHTGPAGSFVDIAVQTLRAAGRIGDGVPAVRVAESEMPRGATEATLVFIPPGDPVEVPAFNQSLAAHGLGWTARPDPARGQLTLSDPDPALPLGGVGVRDRYLLRPSSGGGGADSVLITSSDGEAWLVRGETSDGTFLLLGSALDPASTDLPAHPSMIPFLEALLVRWSHLSAWPPSDFAAGAPMPLPGWVRTVEAPDGTVRRVEPGSPFVPLQPGIYTASDEGGRRTPFAANVPAEESDLTRIAPDRLDDLLPGFDVHPAGPDADAWSGAIYRERRGRDIAPWLIAAALAFVIVELSLATPGRARRRSPATAQRAA